MNYGLYLSASGVLTNLYRQDVLSNNLANVHTVGFKSDTPTIRQRQPESLEGAQPSEFHKKLLDQLGGGVLAGPQRINLQPGALQATSNPLDAALDDSSTFFVVSAVDPRTRQAQALLTRDGRFTLDAQGRLLTAAGRHAVLGPNDQPIVLDPTAKVQINSSGQIFQNGQVVNQLQLATVDDPRQLVKRGQNLLGLANGAGARRAATDAVVHPGHVENSAVDPIRALMDLVSATKSVERNGTLIRYQDQLLDRAVNTLGRVA